MIPEFANYQGPIVDPFVGGTLSGLCVLIAVVTFLSSTAAVFTGVSSYERSYSDPMAVLTWPYFLGMISSFLATLSIIAHCTDRFLAMIVTFVGFVASQAALIIVVQYRARIRQKSPELNRRWVELRSIGVEQSELSEHLSRTIESDRVIQRLLWRQRVCLGTALFLIYGVELLY